MSPLRLPGRLPTIAIVLSALAVYWLLAVTAARHIGVTADEPVHLTAGYSYWRFNDYRLQPENGTLAMRLAALPSLFLPVNWSPDPAEWDHSFVNRIGYGFLFQDGNPRDAMLWAGRALIALTGIATIALTWSWARRLFGAAAGWLALALAVFSPTLLAHGALATSDMTVTFCLLAVVTTFWRLLHRLTLGRLIVAGVAAGAVLLAKMSGVLAAPMLIVMLIVRWCRRTPLVISWGGRSWWARGAAARIAVTSGAAVATAALALVVLWAGYGFRYSAFAGEKSPATQFYFTWSEILDEAPLPDTWPADAASALATTPTPPRPTAVTRFIAAVRDHRLLPEAYLWGMAHTYKFSRVRPAFLNGEFRTTGWKTFFPWTFWLKTTLPTLVLLVAGVAAVCWQQRITGSRRSIWYRATPLLALFVIYWAVALQTKLNIGHRHILPTYPVVFVFAGAAAAWIVRLRKPLAAAALASMVGLHAGESFQARPFYLSYFQPFGGGVDGGWRHLVDSSYDWGQGLPALERWIAERRASGDQRTVYLSYFGADSPRERGLPVVRFADEVNDVGERSYPVRPKGGWFAISATHFHRVYLYLAGPWNEQRERLYQRLRREMARDMPVGLDEAAYGRLVRDAMDFEALEFGRLCHYLREREPDAIVGGSILLFSLTDAEVRDALHGPVNVPANGARERRP